MPKGKKYCYLLTLTHGKRPDAIFHRTIQFFDQTGNQIMIPVKVERSSVLDHIPDCHPVDPKRFGVGRMEADLEAAVEQLPYNTCNHEAEIVADVLEQQARRRRGPAPLGELLPAILARLNVRIKAADRDRDRP